MSHAISVCHGEFGRAAIYQLDRPIITHAHREGHLVFHLDGVPSIMTVAGQTHNSNNTTATAVSPWEPHSFDSRGGETSINLVLYIKPMWFLENTFSAEYALKFGTSKLRLTPRIRELVKLMTVHMLEDEKSSEFNSILFALVKECFDHSWSHSTRDKVREATWKFSDYRVRKSLRMLQENMCKETEMEALARNVGLSRPHFFKLFKQQMGVTPNVYLNTLRSEQAIDDLLTTAKSVTDIAFDLGFSSQSSFTRFFSSNVGISPSEYRRVAHTTGSGFPMMGESSRLSGMPN